MVMMHILRMLTDVSFYCAFAGMIAKGCGGTGAFWGVLLQCLCFGLSYLGRSKRGLRLVFLLPMCLCWIIYSGSPADCILMIPSAMYVIWLVWKNDYVLDTDRQRRLFDVFWKVILIFIAIALLLGGKTLVSAITIPYALMMLIGSVLMLRSLRHDPKVYCQKKYQLLNISAVAAVFAAAVFFSSKTFLNVCSAVWKAFYGHIFRPVLEFLLDVFLLIIWGISQLFALISFKGKEPEKQEVPKIDLGGAEKLLDEEFQLREPGELLRILGIIALVIIAVLLLVLFFRWMNRHNENNVVYNTAADEREVFSAERRPAKKRENSPVRKIRAQYRSFLKWYTGLGMQVERGHTSQDVHRMVDLVTEHGESSEKIRELYIKARYAEKADQEDVRAMKELCGRIKKNEKV